VTVALGSKSAVPTSSTTGLALATTAAVTSTPALLTLPTGAIPTIAAGATWEFWLNATNPTALTSGSLLLYCTNSNTGNGIQVYVTAGGVLNVFITTASGSGGNSTYVLPTDGSSTHIAVVLNAARTQISIYVNGALIATTIAQATPLAQADVPVLRLGAFGTTGAATITLNDVATYSTPLTAARILAHYRAGHDAFAGEVPSARIAHLLSYAAWRTDLQNLDTTSVGDSNSPLQGMTDIAGKSVLQACKDTTNGVLADLDIDGNGKVRYRSRDYRLLQTTPVVTFGEGPPAGNAGEIPYTTAPTIGAQLEKLTPVVEADQVGGISILRGDAPSMLSYGPRKLSISTYLQDPAMVIDLADHLIRTYKAEVQRASAFDVNAAGNPSAWPLMLGLDLAQRARVMRRPGLAPTKQVEVYIEGFTHDVTPSSWTVSGINTSAAPPFFPWILGDATYGVLGTTTIPVF
jgi:hypothetical protein